MSPSQDGPERYSISDWLCGACGNHAEAMTDHWKEGFLDFNEVLKAKCACSQWESEQREDKYVICQSLLMGIQVGLEDSGVEVLCLGDVYLEEFLIIIDDVQVISQGVVKIHELFWFKGAEESAIVMVKNLDDAIGILGTY